MWFQNARAKEKKAKLAAGLSIEDFSVHRNSSGMDECDLCSLTYSSRLSLQEHIFSEKHIEAVKIAVENGTLVPPTPGATCSQESDINDRKDANILNNQADACVKYEPLFLNPTEDLSKQHEQETNNLNVSTTVNTVGECLTEYFDT